MKLYKVMFRWNLTADKMNCVLLQKQNVMFWHILLKNFLFIFSFIFAIKSSGLQNKMKNIGESN